MACLLSSIPWPFTASVRVHLPHFSIDSSPTRIDNLRARTGIPLNVLPIFFLDSRGVWQHYCNGADLGQHRCQQTTNYGDHYTPLVRLSHDFRDHHATTVRPPETPKNTTGKGPMHHWCGRPLRGFEAHAKQRTRGARRTHIAHALRDGQKKRARSISCSRRSLLTSFTASPRHRSARDTLVIGRRAGAMASPTVVGKPRMISRRIELC